MKRLRVVLGLLLAAALACAGLVGALLSTLRPDPAAPELRERPRAARVVQRVAPVDEACWLVVGVRGTDGPLPDATVRVEQPRHQLTPSWTDTLAVDPAGRARVTVKCGRVVVLRVSAPGHGPRIELVHEWDAGETRVEVALEPGARVYGRVTDLDGAPIPDAKVSAGLAEDTTDADGAYELWAVPDQHTVGASAFGYDTDVRALSEALVRQDEGMELDFVLTPRRELRVWCVGLPGDECGAGMQIQCTTPYALVGDRCAYDEEIGGTTCTCPEDSEQVAVRGGGRAVLVEGDAQEAVLDFRDSGTIVGRVAVHGDAPSWCTAIAVRVPEALEDLPRGLVAARQTMCEEDGNFRLEGLVPGDWEVAVRARRADEDAIQERVLVPRAVRASAVVDVGTVNAPGGGTIEGVVIDGVTGEPYARAPVVAMREGEGGERVTMMGDDTSVDGRFRMDGLPAGTWTVAHLLAPQERVTVIVREGAVSDVELVTSDATALEENGFALQDEDGALVVSDVTPGSPADEAGLEPGEEVVGVLVGGFDIAGAVGAKGSGFARAVLGHWDGPGVTLVVRNPDGVEERVPLEW